jgi:glycosyltransferase involved in cell wall biosynthesis/predicted metal-dependent phosphoesterase TrpH
MIKADLHVHSKFSKHPSDWFLQRLGTAESYTEPDFVFESALERGMDFVTLTDHNTIEGALYLKQKYPAQFFTGVESTAYFPEDGCKVHILIYGLDQKQFDVIEKLRENIYELRDFIKKENLAYSVAHATYSVNNRIKVSHLEKLILLFDVFEGMNGARNKAHNESWTKFLHHLSPQDIEQMFKNHRIEPFSADPWLKGFTGGSDDHAGLFVGKTYAQTNARSMEEFLENLKNKKTIANGRNNNFQSLAFTIYKIAYDFYKSKSRAVNGPFLKDLSAYVFENKNLNLKNRFKVSFFKKKGEKSVNQMLEDLLKCLKNIHPSDIEKKLELIYEKVSEIVDEFSRGLFQSLSKEIFEGDWMKALTNFSLFLSGIFLSLPFITSFKHLYNNRNLVALLQKSLNKKENKEGKKILWFTDTLNDLNGVSVTLKKIGWMAHKEGKPFKMVVSLLDEEINGDIPPNLLNLKNVFSFQLPLYQNVKVKIPSLLSALKEIHEFDPDEIVISTPGPVGLLGLFVSRLFGVKNSGIFHTDFSMDVKEISKEEDLANLVEEGLKWFYNSLDEIKAPTLEYSEILSERGYQKDKITVFHRGVDTNHFSPRNSLFAENFSVPKGISLLYVGRISKDKNLDFLGNVYDHLLQRVEKLNLVFIGDGPYLPELKERFRLYPRVLFTGQLDNRKLPEAYSFADIFVFPSITDTFGMAVLEAQSCGLPAVVSDRGGPKEIIVDQKTGLVARANNLKDWENKIFYYIDMILNQMGDYLAIRKQVRQGVLDKYDWKNIFQEIFD